MSLSSALENLFCGQGSCLWISRLRLGIKPGSQRGPGRQRFPAAAEPARTLRAGGVDHVMADFGMRFIRAALQPPLENNSAANPRAHGDVNQQRLPFSRASCSFSQRAGGASSSELSAVAEL